MGCSPLAVVRSREQLRYKVLALVDSTRFNLAVVLVVLVDLGVFFLEEWKEGFDALGKATFVCVGGVVVAFFVCEMLLKFYGYGLVEFFGLAWNVIDLFIVGVTVVGYFLWIFLDDAGNVANAADGATTIRLVRVFRILRLLRVFHAIRALSELHFTYASEDRISVPARKCVHILTNLRHVFKLRFVATMVKSVVTPQEITWVIKIINSGVLTKHFMEQRLDDDMRRFLQQTCSVLCPLYDPTPFGNLNQLGVLPFGHAILQQYALAEGEAASEPRTVPHRLGGQGEGKEGEGKEGEGKEDEEEGSVPLVDGGIELRPVRPSTAPSPSQPNNNNGNDDDDDHYNKDGDHQRLSAGGRGGGGHSLSRSSSGMDNAEARLDRIVVKMDAWDFDVFALRACEGVGDRPLFVVGLCALHGLGLMQQLKLDPVAVRGFLWAADALHRETNPYHNSTHVADVTHAMYYFLQVMGLKRFLHPLETLAAILSAIVHDLDHPGANNQFYVVARDEIAVTYNDKSVIENYSLARAFELLESPGADVLATFVHEDRMYVRQCITDNVLATDNARHFELLGQFKALQMNRMIDFNDPDHRAIVVQIGLHCADVSNPSKAAWLSNQWSERVQREFWEQGDRERAMGRTPGKFWDRRADPINVPLLQLSFIEFVVQPLFTVWALFVRDVVPKYKDTAMETNVAANKKFWADKLLEMKRARGAAAPSDPPQ